MKLRYRLLLFVSLTLVCLVVGINLYSSRLMLQSFAKLENQAMERDVKRVSYTFAQMQQNMKGKTVDWAEWDDTYKFVKDRNKAYIESNIVDDGFIKMEMDTAIFLDTHESIVHSHPVKRSNGLRPPDTAQILRAIHREGSLTSAMQGKGSVCGVLMMPEAPLFLCAMPILPTSGKGQSRGWILFGRYFDREQSRQLQDNTQLDVQAVRMDDAAMSADCREALHLLSSSPLIIRPQDEKTIAGYTQVKDIFGKPVLLLRLTKSRAIHAQGLASIATLNRTILIAGILFGGVVLFVLERFALSRLSRLSHQVETIGDNATAATVHLPGRDELSGLAAAINGMLGKLERGAQKLRESEEQLRLYNDNLEQTVQQRTQQLEYQAFHDTLTGLPNRALFMNRIEFTLAKAQRSQRGTAALFIDLDNFKLINDSLGHDAGDCLLKAVAERLSNFVRPGDTVARLGGDEFTVLLEDLSSPDQATEVAQRILESMRSPITLPQSEAFTSASIGIAYTSNTEITPEELMKQADTAMYYAKAKGKSDVAFYEEGMHDCADERLELETGLRKALEQNEIRVHYQPLIDLKTGLFSGAEALARWQHPIRGLVSPGQFIPIAEETGLIIPIGYWILEEACRQTVLWRDEYAAEAFAISVNLSGKQLQRPDVVERVAEILERTGLPPACLKLEITESVLMADMADVIAKMHRLKALGIKLAIDDFGTGYSSLSSLSTFPVDTIKIDRAFISLLGEQAEANSIVEAITMLSHGMKMDVTCEGVETETQVAHIQGLGCETGQGYLFAKPLTASDFGTRLSAGGVALLQQSEFSHSDVEALLHELSDLPNLRAA